MIADRRRWPILAGVLIIVLTNAVALSGAIFNRSGTPESTLTLTERELVVPYNWRTSENSGLALRLAWQTMGHEGTAASTMGAWWDGADWLDAAKLAELGLKVHARPLGNADVRSYGNSVSKDVLLVLEMNGATYQRQIDRVCKAVEASTAQHAKEACDREKTRASRLFVVDAGLDRDALRMKYADATKYAIVHGQVAATVETTISGSRTSGFVRGVSTDELQVPASMRSVLGTSDDEARWVALDRSKPFKATVAFGRRLEPWILQLSAEGANGS